MSAEPVMSDARIIIELLVIQQKMADLVEDAYREGMGAAGRGWDWETSYTKKALEELL